MLILQAAQKLLNTSRLEASLYVSQPSEGQLLHSWYCRLLPTGFPGKLMVMYVHEPSLMTIVCRGKTIKGSWEEFVHRLPLLLEKYNFQPSFILSEMAYVNGYVVGKTNSRSMLGYMNQQVMQLEYDCSKFDSYDDISQNVLEGRMMEYLYQPTDKKKPYTTAVEYWKEWMILP